MCKGNSFQCRIAAGCVLISSFGLLSGCRSAPVRMPCWPWSHDAAQTVTEPTPVEKTYNSKPSPLNEPLPAPPLPTFEGSGSDPSRVPPAPAPMPDEIIPGPNLRQESEDLPRLDGIPQQETESLPPVNSETGFKRPVNLPGRKLSGDDAVPFGHSPLPDQSGSAVELKASSSVLYGKSPKVDPGRNVRRTRFE